MRKGISPLIASVLLLAFTMSVALVAGPWFSQLTKDAQADTSDRAKKLQEVASTTIEIEKTKYDSSSGNYTVTVQNTGENKIKNYTATITGGGAEPVQKKLDKTLNAGEIHTFTIQTDNSTEEDTLSVDAQNIPVSKEQDLDNIVTGSAPASPSGLSLKT